MNGYSEELQKGEEDASEIEEINYIVERQQQRKCQNEQWFQFAQVLMAWLMEQRATGLGTGVPTHLTRYAIDLAAFWSKPQKKILAPVHSIGIEIRVDRQQCWLPSTSQSGLTAALIQERRELSQLEEYLRRHQPHLLDTQFLFHDHAEWRYEQTDWSPYHECRKRIRHLEKELYKGTHFERIAKAQVADQLYLAAPEGVVTPEELGEEWGLLEITPQFKVKIVKEAPNLRCSTARRMHLIQNIALANQAAVLFANGVSYRLGKSKFYCPPRRRHKPSIDSKSVE